MAQAHEFTEEELDRLDRLDINRTPKDILRDLMWSAGGDPMVALQRLIERAIEVEDERDIARLQLAEYQEKAGLAPMVEDRERLQAHILKRMQLRNEQEEDEDLGFSKEELDYIDAVGWEEAVESRGRDWRDPSRCPQGPVDSK
ncbi:hypothetical protein GCM10007874_11430 [Labrys miyagiensis]|uniref:Uncharacterized protein n=1 Tax=Labrys miyagiensis TaxID=346912 RepID=A0ABQ6CEP4_9HYPH|nr:hypothetical protein [Labrys miyagiensis]GLS18127.1 hypothetical protein GCM10007874_11430 [Labrys miyagiensis]